MARERAESARVFLMVSKGDGEREGRGGEQTYASRRSKGSDSEEEEEEEGEANRLYLLK